VVLEATNRRKTVKANSKPFDRQVEGLRHRYNLATALRIVRRMETSSVRGAVFAEIKRKNPLYGIVDWLYSKAGANSVQPLVLLLYMLKCVLSLGPSRNEIHDAVSIASFENERHAIDRLVALMPGARVHCLSLDRRHLIGRGQLGAALRILGSAPRVWRYLACLSRTYGFMPAARIASALAHYIRCSQLFAERPGLTAAIVASNYSPEALGLAAAAHRSGRRVIYVNHAPVPANGALVPPVLADCAVFYGDAIRRTYQRESRCTAEVALIGQAGSASPMQWRDDARTVGIFLTALTLPDAVARLVAAIAIDRPDARILIRNHPVALLRSDFSGLAARYENLTISIGQPLDDEIAACDLVFCGNSGVALNVLRGGRPVAYLDSIDGLTFDYNGFVESKLICPVEGWRDDLYTRLRNFYTQPEWREVMQSYDASYGVDASVLERKAAELVGRHVKQLPDPGSTASRGQWPSQRFFPRPT
jgi:hypothetical protein